jgi:hypothetical protein
MDAKPPQMAPDWLIKQLEESEAEIAAGHAVPLEPFLERLRDSIARMEAGEGAATEMDPGKL